MDTILADLPVAHAPAAAELKSVNLALQGGGAHGAFTWGVLDRLLEEPRLRFDGVSATSAGAMNAAVLAYGLTVGGRDGAKRALAHFWRRISRAAAYGPMQPTVLDRMLERHTLDWSPGFVMFELMTRFLSPYQLNPLNLNPLRDALTDTVDFAALQSAGCPIKLFLAATNVRTGKVRVFTNREIGPDAVLASGCLPFLFQAVEIDGEAYWDGGYMGNPAIFPLIYGSSSRDVVVVHVNPLERPGVPRTASDILSRINEISFNSSLMREMRAISFVTKLIDDGQADGEQLKRMLIHSIAADDVMVGLGHTSKLNADWAFLTHLRDVGRERASLWIDEAFDRLGRESTVDLRTRYL